MEPESRAEDLKLEPNLPLPLPSALRTMFESSTKRKELEDDPGIHCGKIRSFAHVRGNWASFVHISCMKRELQ
jgi:hypothetical protein